MNRITVTVEVAKDGGLVVYSDDGIVNQMDLVFGGNQKDTCDYIAKRVGELKAEKVAARPVSLREAYIGLTEDEVVEFRRAGAAV